MDQIDELLEFLAREEGSCTVDEISKSIPISNYRCENMIDFLVKYGFVHLENLKVRIDPEVREFVIATSGKSYLQLVPTMATHTSLIQRRKKG